MKSVVTLLALGASAAYATSSLPPYKSPKTVKELHRDLKELGLQPTSHKLSVKAGASNCTQACASLERFLPHGTISPTDAVGYADESRRYWSGQQAAQTPACYFLPKVANQVAGAVLTAEFYKCSFAVKSGGHAAFAGASNIDQGITVDLRKISQINVSKDQMTAKIGTGLHWGDVYSALDPLGLSVIGGRVSAIGVGGLTLGGGISFFSGRYGWACDNVRNYQLVMAGGRIVDVNDSHDSYPDLYRALRGGGNNFGIVTRLDLITHQQGKLWGGVVTYNHSKSTQLYHALSNFALNAPTDPDAHVYVALAYFQGQFFFSDAYDYAKPVKNPPVFHEFTSIANLTSTMRITKLTPLTTEINESNPNGNRETYTTATYTMSVPLLKDIDAIFCEEVQKLSDVLGYIPAATFQAITRNEVQHFSKRGGNSLGISKAETPLLLLDLAVMWTSSADDERVLASTQRILSRANARAAELGLDNKYIYQNYASLNQDVFAGYGKSNLQALRATSQKYDPQQVFQKLQPGYFKLSGSNGGSPTRT